MKLQVQSTLHLCLSKGAHIYMKGS